MRPKICACLLLTLLFFKESHAKMTEAQVQAVSKVTRNVCQPKSKVTDEEIDNAKNGIWDDNSKPLKCYMECCLKMFKVMKNGALDFESAINEANKLPDERRERAIPAMTSCKDKAVGTEKCEASYNYAKCIQQTDPKTDLIP
nr:odorant-binding protein [Lasioderma serricorne]